jgi:hypothetical protein
MTSTLAVAGNATFSGNLIVDTNTFFVDSVNNRVGIGTTTPLVTCHLQNTDISGGEKIVLRLSGGYGSTDFYGTHFNIANINLNSSQNLYIGRGGGGLGIGTYAGSGIFSKFVVNGNAVIGSGYYPLVAPANGFIVEGNVGIGNISPSEKLTVSGNISASGTITGSNLVYSTNTNQRIDGQKTFLQNIVGNGTANRLPNQTATTDDAVMTRSLGDARYGGQVYIVRISSDEASSNSTAWVNSPQTLSLPAGTYIFDSVFIGQAASTTSGINLGPVLSTADSNTCGELTITQLTTDGSNANPSSFSRLGSNVMQYLICYSFAPENASRRICIGKTSGTCVFASPTVITFRIAQRVTDAVNPVVIKTGSYARFIKIS